jgi:hypothetical protein
MFKLLLQLRQTDFLRHFLGLLFVAAIIWSFVTPLTIDAQEQQLISQNCQGNCSINIPSSLQPGSYLLKAYITKSGSRNILHQDQIQFKVADSQRTCSGKCYLTIPPFIAQDSYILSATISPLARPSQILYSSNINFNIKGTQIPQTRLTSGLGLPACSAADQLAGKCTGSEGQTCSNGQIRTSLGCVSAEPGSLTNTLIQLLIGASGGISLILMILGAIQMITSSGNKDKIRDGRDRFVSALIGLVFVSLSIILMQIIGLNILNIPGFGR